jgi:hypothetical protein
MILSDKATLVFYSYHIIQKPTNTTADVLIVFFHYLQEHIWLAYNFRVQRHLKYTDTFQSESI